MLTPYIMRNAVIIDYDSEGFEIHMSVGDKKQRIDYTRLYNSKVA